MVSATSKQCAAGGLREGEFVSITRELKDWTMMETVGWMMETDATYGKWVRTHQRCLTAVVALGLLVLPGRSVAAQTPTAAKDQASTHLKTGPRLLRSA